MNFESSPSVPDGWHQPSPELLAHAKVRSLEALQGNGVNPAPDRLARFYSSTSDYAGASFAQLLPIDPLDLTPSDLLATTLMSVRIGPGATRRILQDGTTRTALLGKLAKVPVTELSCAGIPELLAMADLYEEVKRALSAETVKRPNAWVTASKLCARKRPNLFPARDRGVCKYLGLTHFKNYEIDWQIYRSLISDREVIAAIDRVAEEARKKAGIGQPMKLDSSRLRLLDAAIWTYTK